MNKMIKTMSDKELLHQVNKFRKESEHKKRYGDYGTGNYVSSHEFWGRTGKKEIMAELERRKNKGKIRADAGKPKKARQYKPRSLLDETAFDWNW